MLDKVMKHSCASDTMNETDQCINNCVRPKKMQHPMCCCLCGKVEHKKVKFFAREKSRNMAKKVNNTFSKPRGLKRCS